MSDLINYIHITFNAFVCNSDSFAFISESNMFACSPLETATATAKQNNHRNSLHITLRVKLASHIFLSHPFMCSQTPERNCTSITTTTITTTTATVNVPLLVGGRRQAGRVIGWLVG